MFSRPEITRKEIALGALVLGFFVGCGLQRRVTVASSSLPPRVVVEDVHLKGDSETCLLGKSPIQIDATDETYLLASGPRFSSFTTGLKRNSASGKYSFEMRWKNEGAAPIQWLVYTAPLAVPLDERESTLDGTAAAFIADDLEPGNLYEFRFAAKLPPPQATPDTVFFLKRVHLDLRTGGNHAK